MTVAFTDIEDDQPVWIIVAVAAVAVVGLVSIGVLLCCTACCRKLRNSSKQKKPPSTDTAIRTLSCLREQTVSQASILLTRTPITYTPRMNPRPIRTTSTASSSASLSSSSSSPSPPPPSRTSTHHSSATPETTTDTRRGKATRAGRCTN